LSDLFICSGSRCCTFQTALSVLDRGRETQPSGSFLGSFDNYLAAMLMLGWFVDTAAMIVHNAGNFRSTGFFGFCCCFSPQCQQSLSPRS
jgi:hypothetical protein